MAGRGSFIESFPLFGYDLDDYDELFAEKLDLLLRFARVRARHLVGPPPRRDRRPRRLPAPAAGSAAGLGRGRRDAAVGRAGRRARAAARARDHRRPAGALRAARRPLPRGRPPRRPRPAPLPLGVNSHGFVADTTAGGGRDVLRALRRGDDAARPRARLAADVAAAVRGAALARAARSRRRPREVAAKILRSAELFGLDRYPAARSASARMPHADVMRSIELLGTEVAPAVRAARSRETIPSVAVKMR